MIDGLKITGQLKKTERFESFEAEYQGQKAFAKHALSDNTATHLIFQARNSQIVDDIGGDLLRAPKVLAKNQDWIVTEWIDGPALEDSLEADPSAVAEATARVVNIFDSQPDATTPLREIFSYEGLKRRVEQRIAEEIKRTSGTILGDSLELFKSLQPSLKACLQDADIQPEHLFIDQTGRAKYILIDSEHLNTHWPRFYDLANNYSKYWKRDNRQFSALVLEKYQQISGRSGEIFESFCASLIVRALALHWENDYDPGAADTNIPRSQELLRKVLQADSISHLL